MINFLVTLQSFRSVLLTWLFSSDHFESAHFSLLLLERSTSTSTSSHTTKRKLCSLSSSHSKMLNNNKIVKAPCTVHVRISELSCCVLSRVYFAPHSWLSVIRGAVFGPVRVKQLKTAAAAATANDATSSNGRWRRLTILRACCLTDECSGVGSTACLCSFVWFACVFYAFSFVRSRLLRSIVEKLVSRIYANGKIDFSANACDIWKTALRLLRLTRLNSGKKASRIW